MNFFFVLHFIVETFAHSSSSSCSEHKSFIQSLGMHLRKKRERAAETHTLSLKSHAKHHFKVHATLNQNVIQSIQPTHTHTRTYHRGFLSYSLCASFASWLLFLIDYPQKDETKTWTSASKSTFLTIEWHMSVRTSTCIRQEMNTYHISFYFHFLVSVFIFLRVHWSRSRHLRTARLIWKWVL